jgi:hypothetical protein
MPKGIVISADFSDPGSPILAGPTEKELNATTQRVAAGPNPRLRAVSLLGTGFSRALVIDHRFDAEEGWTTSRQNFRRKARPGEAA